MESDEQEECSIFELSSICSNVTNLSMELMLLGFNIDRMGFKRASLGSAFSVLYQKRAL